MPTHVHLLNFLTVSLIFIWQSQKMDVHCFIFIFMDLTHFKDIMVDNSYLLIQWKFVLYCVNFEFINMDLF